MGFRIENFFESDNFIEKQTWPSCKSDPDERKKGKLLIWLKLAILVKNEK